MKILNIGKSYWICMFSLWAQMMQQLRQGIKLKKVDYSKTPSEYGMTPYEMLMDDIRYAIDNTYIPDQTNQGVSIFSVRSGKLMSIVFCLYWHYG